MKRIIIRFGDTIFPIIELENSKFEENLVYNNNPLDSIADKINIKPKKPNNENGFSCMK